MIGQNPRNLHLPCAGPGKFRPCTMDSLRCSPFTGPRQCTMDAIPCKQGHSTIFTGQIQSVIESVPRDTGRVSRDIGRVSLCSARFHEILDKFLEILDFFLEILDKFLQKRPDTKLYLSDSSRNLSNIKLNLSNITQRSFQIGLICVAVKSVS